MCYAVSRPRKMSTCDHSPHPKEVEGIAIHDLTLLVGRIDLTGVLVFKLIQLVRVQIHRA